MDKAVSSPTMLQSPARKRIDWIDMAKGYGMILVIIGHIVVSHGTVYTLISSFHMPLFFILSGYLFSNKRSFKEFFIKRIKSLVVPYFCLCIPLLISKAINGLIDGNYTSLTDTVVYTYQYFMKFVVQKRESTLWFVACLFVINIIFYFLSKLVKNDYALLVTSFIIGFAGLMYCKYVAVYLPWAADLALTAIPFFALGYFSKNKNLVTKIVENKYSVIYAVIAAIIWILSLIGSLKLSDNTVFNMHGSEFGWWPLSYLGAISASLALIIISSKATFKSIMYIGQNTMLYLAWHQSLIINNLRHVFNRFKIFQSGYSLLISYVIIFASCIVVLTLLNKLISKSKLKFILGK